MDKAHIYRRQWWAEHRDEQMKRRRDQYKRKLGLPTQTLCGCGAPAVEGNTGKGKYCDPCRRALRQECARKYAHPANRGRRHHRERVVKQSTTRSRNRKLKRPDGWEEVVRLAHREEGGRLRSLLEVWQKYRLEAHDWALIYERQGRLCPACGKALDPSKACVDHDHHIGSAKPEAVRGLLHWRCNRHMVGQLTTETARRVLAYLEAFDRQRPGLAA